MTRPAVNLSVLRRIGWEEWDPIGLKGAAPDDEYDAYLLSIAGEIQGGKGDDMLVAQLMQIESEHMGMGVSSTTRVRAEATIAEIRKFVDSANDSATHSA
jgi:hypothetical protein